MRRNREVIDSLMACDHWGEQMRRKKLFDEFFFYY